MKKNTTILVYTGKIIVAFFKLIGVSVISFIRSLPQRFYTLGMIFFDNRRQILANIICILYLSLFSILQTTFFSVYKPFNVIPDLILMTIVAIAINEGPILGGTYGIVGGLLYIGLCNTHNFILPLIYFVIGFFIGYIKTNYFTDGFLTRLISVGITAILKLITSMAEMIAFTSFSFSTSITKVLFPEFLTICLFSIIPHLFIHISLKWYHKPHSTTYKQMVLKTISPKKNNEK